MNTEYGRIWDWKSHEDSPLRWRNPCVARLKGDPFEETPFEVLDRVFAVMVLRPDVTFQLLTKRPERMREYIAEDPFGAAERVWGKWDALAHHAEAPEWLGWPLPNVWLGVSVEDQRWADARLPELLATPAAVRFVSCEPMLGPVDFCLWSVRLTCCGLADGLVARGTWKEADELRNSYLNAFGHERTAIIERPLDWVIFGGESGPGARPCDIAWIQAGVEQCRAAGVPAFVKQLGAKPIADGLGPRGPNYQDWLHLKDRKGGDMAEWPEDLRIREMPTSGVNNGSR